MYQQNNWKVGILFNTWNREENIVVYAPKGEVKETLTVFSDKTCTNCRKLHSGLQQLLDVG